MSKESAPGGRVPQEVAMKPESSNMRHGLSAAFFIILAVGATYASLHQDIHNTHSTVTISGSAGPTPKEVFSSPLLHINRKP